MAGELRREGTHYLHKDLELWAEEGLIFIEDRKKGDFQINTCADMKERAIALYKESKRADTHPDARDELNKWVITINEAWRDAKAQGDPMDVEVAKAQYRQRRKAVMVTGMWQ